MKKAFAFILAFVVFLALSACSNKPTAQNDPVEHLSSEPSAKPEPSQEGQEPAADWNDYAEIFTHTLSGTAQYGESVVFVSNEDGSFGALAVVNTETMEFVSFAGAMSPIEFQDGGLGYAITYDQKGSIFSFSCVYNDDGSADIDLGDYGAITVSPCEPAEAFELLNAIDAEITAVL